MASAKTIALRNLDRQDELINRLDRRFKGQSLAQAFISAANGFLDLEEEYKELKEQLRQARIELREYRSATSQYLAGLDKLNKLNEGTKNEGGHIHEMF